VHVHLLLRRTQTREFIELARVIPCLEEQNRWNKFTSQTCRQKEKESSKR
jgi:hypothetical protein